MEKPEYVYIMCPVPIQLLADLPIPLFGTNPNFSVPFAEDETFEPSWYGNAQFPEDDL